MSRAEHLLQFAVRFARMNIDQLRSGDVLNLQEDIWHFLFPTGNLEDSSAFPEQAPDEISVDDIKMLQHEVKDILNIVVDREERASYLPGPGPGPDPVLLFFSPQLSVKTGLAVFPAHASDHVAPIFSGPIRDAVLMQLLIALMQISSLDTLRRCPECQNIFYRVRHQRFCSPTCRNRANTRHFREVHNREQLDRQADQRMEQKHRTATTV